MRCSTGVDVEAADIGSSITAGTRVCVVDTVLNVFVPVIEVAGHISDVVPEVRPWVTGEVSVYMTLWGTQGVVGRATVGGSGGVLWAALGVPDDDGGCFGVVGISVPSAWGTEILGGMLMFTNGQCGVVGLSERGVGVIWM